MVQPPLPPNRTCGSPASGSPVGGFTSKRIGETSMGRVQEQQPLLGDQSRVWVAPRGEGRQQWVRPRSRFELARPVRRGLSAVASPIVCGVRALASGYVHGLGRCHSTSLRPLAPPELPGFNATMGALTPARRLSVAWIRAGLSALCVGPSIHSAPNHLQGPAISFSRSGSLSRASDSRRFGTSSFPSGLVTLGGRIGFTCVADWMFAFRCFPPRLATTQLRLASSRRAINLRRTCTSLT